MSEPDSAISVIQPKLSTAAGRAASVFGYSVVAAAYAAIFVTALLTLGLILIRQTNIVNFNYLIASLDERDRATQQMPDILKRLQYNQQKYNETLNAITTCMPGKVSPQSTNRAFDTQSAAAGPSLTCDDLLKIRDKSAELKKNELDILFKQANLKSWYQSNTDGIRKQMPQTIPALRFLDSAHSWVDVWARSPFELMQMYLLVLMGMLGGVIKATEWLIKPAATPSWFEYFYKPVLGGVIALGVFVAFKATELIIVGPASDGTATVAASVFLLAALGLVSGFGADKAPEQIEKAAEGIFAAGRPRGGLR